MKIYISGPMTGLPEFNFPAFNAMASRIKENGDEPLNPADLEFVNNPRCYHMRKDIEMVLQADGVVLLPGWEQSKGAQLEVAIAKELELPIYNCGFEPMYWTKGTSIFNEAAQLVAHDRQSEYGPPSKSFANIAAMWSIITGFPISAYTVALCMAALKLCRESNKPKRDNRVDAVAYIELADRLL